MDRRPLLCITLCLSLSLYGCERGTSISVDPQTPVTVDMWPKWSPSASTEIAYTHRAQTVEEIEEFGMISTWVVDILTGETRHLTEGAACDWSPGGDSIVFALGGIWLIDLDTGQKQDLTCQGSLSCAHVDADFSPTGTKIAYVSEDSPQRGIWVVDLPSMSNEWVCHRYGPDWSHDGNEILCDSLVIVLADGTRVRKVPYDPMLSHPIHAQWSPDGSQIAFGAQRQDGERGVWLIGVDGDRLRLVSDGATPSWSPDGSMLAYGGLSADGRATAIWIMNCDGTGKRQITFP